MDQKFLDVLAGMGIDAKTRPGKQAALSIPDDVEKSKAFLAGFAPDVAPPETDAEVASVTETIIREHLTMPEVKGDPAMAKAKKTVKKAAKAKAKAVAKKAPKVAKKAPKVAKPKAAKAARERGTEPKAGTVAAKLWKLLDRANGATKAELLSASGWKACGAYCKKMADDYGRKLERTKDEGKVSRWRLV